jgi:hypothetical protein
VKREPPVVSSSGFEFVHAPHAVVIRACPRALVPLAELEYLREVASFRYGWRGGRVAEVARQGSLDIVTVSVEIGGEAAVQSITFDVGRFGWIAARFARWRRRWFRRRRWPGRRRRSPRRRGA